MMSMGPKNQKEIEFYCNKKITQFLLCDRLLDEAEYAIFGVPFDKTSTFRSGSKFAPSSIREASLNIESYDIQTELDLEDIKICDIGDLNIANDLNETLKRVESVVKILTQAKKIPIIIGGEHTITKGAFQAFNEDCGIVIFDAHLDLRNDYLGSAVSHATFVRRLTEEVGSDRIVLVGTRAVCKEEIKFAKKIKLSYIPAFEIEKNPNNKIIDLIKLNIRDFEKVYFSFDMDVLDPAFAPAVGNPEGNGLRISDAIDIIVGLCDKDIVAFDLTEVTPNYDFGVTSIQAANIISKIICNLEKNRTKK
jgi:agmatinase